MEHRYVCLVDHRSLDFRRAAPGPSDVDVVGGLVAGLLTDAPRVLTGAAMGPVHVVVHPLREAPEDLAAEWQDVVEVSLVSRGGPMVVTGPFDADPEPAARLDLYGPGTYRVRVHADGRDLDFDAVVREPRERYLIQSWPADPQTPVTLRAASRTAEISSSAPRVRAQEAVAVRPPIDPERQEALERSIRAHRGSGHARD